MSYYTARQHQNSPNVLWTHVPYSEKKNYV